MIQLKKITKQYKNTVVFENTDFLFDNKGLVCLLGPSGCGKSTLLNILAGFDSDYSGDIIVHDTSITNMRVDDLCEYRKNNIGFIFQNYHLLSGYTVLENILIASKLNGIDEKENIKQAEELLNKLGLSDKINQKIENLSGGQKQRVAIARALINNPTIILADEPTGALDRKTSMEIMELLKEISKDRLVIVITHDKKICDSADEVIHIVDKKIVTERNKLDVTNTTKLKKNKRVTVSSLSLGIKSFKVKILKYLAISFSLALGIFAFILSLSTSNIIDKSINEFKNKNTAFNNGYIKIESEKDIPNVLKENERIDQIYYQYIINDVSLKLNNKEEVMKEKYPMPKALENMSYGIMPRIAKKEIALSPSLAKKFSKDIHKLIGEKIILTHNHISYELVVSGIFNASYDDFYVSSDIEQAFYKNEKVENAYSITYDVKDFKDVIAIDKLLKENNIESKSAVKEIIVLQDTFDSISRLFLIVSILILGICLFISITLLVKLQNSRYKELGLLSALGFHKKNIRRMIITENILLSLLAIVFNGILIILVYFFSIIFNIEIILLPLQIVISIVLTGIVVIILGLIINQKLLNTEPAIALKK